MSARTAPMPNLLMSPFTYLQPTSLCCHLLAYLVYALAPHFSAHVVYAAYLGSCLPIFKTSTSGPLPCCGLCTPYIHSKIPTCHAVRLVLVLHPAHCLMAPSTESWTRTYEAPAHPNRESKLPNPVSHQTHAAYAPHPTPCIVRTTRPTSHNTR